MNDRLSLEGLRYVAAVHRCGSLSGAAREFGVTQPALSTAVRKVEEFMGHPLFERSTQGVAPTPFGGTVIGLIEDAVAAADRVAAASRRGKAAPARLAVGASPLIPHRLVERLRHAAAAHPRLGADALVLHEGDLMDLQLRLDSGDIDTAIVPAVLPATRYRKREIGSEAMRLVDAPGRSHPGTAPVTTDEATARTLVLVAPTCGLTAFTEALFRAAGAPLHEHPRRAASYRVLEDWVSLGLGSAILPESKATRPDLVGHDLVDSDGNPVIMRYRAYWRDGSPMAPVIDEVMLALDEDA